MPKIRIRRGTEASILFSDDMMIGELGFATDSKSLFAFDGISKHMVGKVVVSAMAYRPPSGVNGRFFYAEDTGELYLDLVSTWIQVNASSLPTTLSGIGGITTYKEGGVWYVDGSLLNQTDLVTTVSRGEGHFSPDGYIIVHGAGNLTHYTDVTVAGSTPFDEYETASIGDIYIETGLNQDTVYNTGGPSTSGIGFHWEVTCTSSGSEPRHSSIRGQSVFAVSGTVLQHSLNNVDHYTSITPIGFDLYTMASIGNIYIRFGANTDTVYVTGGPQADGIPFYWKVCYDVPDGQTYNKEELARGIAGFSSEGTIISHGLGLDHFLSVIPAGSSTYDEAGTASIGEVTVVLGEQFDTVYHSGGAEADGLTFYWEITSSGTLIQSCATFDQLTAVRDELIAYVDQEVTTITNLVPSVTVSGNLMGTGVLTYQGGYILEHNLGTVQHYVSVTLADTSDYDEYTIASVGNVYVKKGVNQDIVFHTGGAAVDGLKFDWEIIKHGLKMVE